MQRGRRETTDFTDGNARWGAPIRNGERGIDSRQAREGRKEDVGAALCRDPTKQFHPNRGINPLLQLKTTTLQAFFRSRSGSRSRSRSRLRAILFIHVPFPILPITPPLHHSTTPFPHSLLLLCAFVPLCLCASVPFSLPFSLPSFSG